MRSGRFETLDQVLEQYSPNIANHNNLDSRLKTASGNAAQMNILRQEKEALITFLGAFTDVSMIGDPMDSNRFRY